MEVCDADCFLVVLCWQTSAVAKVPASAKRTEKESGLDWAEEILVTKADLEESNAARAELMVRRWIMPRCGHGCVVTEVSILTYGGWCGVVVWTRCHDRPRLRS